MKISSAFSADFLFASAIHFVAGNPGNHVQFSSRKTNILISPPGLPNLPTAVEIRSAATNYRIGMKKNKELFLFFSITNATLFKQKLKADIKNRVTTTSQLLFGLNVLGVTDSLGDALFTNGQEADAVALGDPGTSSWANLDNFVKDMQSLLQGSVKEVYRLAGLPVRDHRQGMSAIDGSSLAFRQLEQKVPEFNRFLTDNPLIILGLTYQQGSDLLGARMVGRWKSGAPVDLAPLIDDQALGADPTRNKDLNILTKHRADFDAINTLDQIIRAGIPYGPKQ
ncbi:hypothetical protein M422DRAFT_262542 [Sphaerobolus stellatus SS14]|uniref:DyP dimeric alpha+beta barrel domain-containing protein n=1 Tax=Sphaerobolus stellatus (strain SS14) TaxID=990650 RepID=A0A0C9UJX0_SPHS4|nr:hypothetical protein M422DRAFT_262542 [Sphaerobolus stellatus SS14]